MNYLWIFILKNLLTECGLSVISQTGQFIIRITNVTYRYYYRSIFVYLTLPPIKPQNTLILKYNYHFAYFLNSFYTNYRNYVTNNQIS